ncbi:MAG: preprotein translocase subunit SecE [Candidatus Hydrogenedentes bacterium]|nr:preprotein translocase subunit SecE [Candidatus Hydrogenedentota bacterium]
MAKQTVVENKKPGFFATVQEFYEDVMAELKKVTWPTRADLMASTKVTLFLIVVMAITTFLFDTVLGGAIMALLSMAS